MRRLIAAAALAASLVMPSLALGQDFPNRLVRIIVNSQTGGTADQASRLLADELSRRWSQPVVVEDVAGAGGNIGAAQALRAEPDGHTLLVSHPGPLTINGLLFKSMSYDPAKVAPVSGLGGAAIDPTEIKRSLPVPDDFDSFWDGMKKKLAAVPLEPKLVSVKSPIKDVESFDVTAPALGLQISGYMSKPVGAKPKSLPIILTVHGAGVSDSSLGGSANWASKGFLAMDMNAHGLPNGKPKQFYADLYAGPMNPYRYEFRNDREKAYFTGMMLRLIRGIDVLTAQPEWDGKHVVVSGASQGGYQAIAAAGLDARVTFFAAGVPAGCDHSGMLANRIAGWPKIVPMKDGKPDSSVIEAFRYLDCMNFATRTKAAGCYFTVGFIDVTCPPTSIYATYNQLTIPKEIYNDIPSGHSHSSAAREGMTNAVMKHVGK